MGEEVPGACDPGTTETEWATSCPTAPAKACTPGTWTAWGSSSPENYPFRYETEHFAFYWPDGRGVTLAQAEAAGKFLEEEVWATFFGSPMFFPEPDCDRTDKRKTSIHIIESGLFGGCNSGRPGMWVGPGAITNLDRWGFAHEFTHAVQCLTPAFPDCGGQGCWIFESHANWMPHQLERYREDVHCSEMLVNMPHLYYGSTRDRYCNWQFFEFLKDKHCYSAVSDMWTSQAPSGKGDPWEKLMLSQGWGIEELNDLFGEWAMHNVTWDYKNPPPTDGSHHGSVYRARFGSIEDTEGRTERRLRLTRLEALDENWAENRRFVSPYYWAPQRWGYNVVRLHVEPGAESVRVSFRGVLQEGASSGWRWGLVATNADLTSARYSALQRGSDGELHFCVQPDEQLYLVVTATPTTYQKITWGSPGDGAPYPSIYRYPYMVQLEGAWPAGFRDGALEDCPAGLERHPNGGGCAPPGTPESVYVGPYAKVLGGTVSGAARIEDHATIVNGTVSGGTVGALSLVGQGGGGTPSRSFNVSGSAKVLGTFYPLSWFVNGLTASGTATFVGDLEIYSSKSSGLWFGLVDDNGSGSGTHQEVTIPPPYAWRP